MQHPSFIEFRSALLASKLKVLSRNLRPTSSVNTPILFGTKHMKHKGFSLLETMLVLSIGTGLLVTAFLLNKSRQESLSVEDARSQLTQIAKSLNPIKNTLTSYDPLIPTTGLTSPQSKLLLPPELLDATGSLSSAWGPVDLGLTLRGLSVWHSITVRVDPQMVSVSVVPLLEAHCAPKVLPLALPLVP